MSKIGKYFPFSDMRNFFEPERRMFYSRMIAAPYRGTKYTEMLLLLLNKVM